MKTESLPSASSGRRLPDAWRRELAPRLAGGEEILAWLELDLDARLHFGHGLVVATGQRLLAKEGEEGVWQDWPYREDLALRHHDHAGVGSLELRDGTMRLAHWRFTLGRNPQALQLIKQFERQLASRLSGRPAAAEAEAVCPKCKTPLEPGQDECPLCTQEIHAPPSTWTLFRLWRFAKPYYGQLLAGFLLTLASTAATLVPPYLTMPLMDKVLIPYQNGIPIDIHIVALLLAGLLGSALLAWSLGWARTYILALVSERIGADLRTATYEHLLRLSLEYFGGKRTGDLMARIGSESDRICVFLSLHLMDFATDVLMIVMTAAILAAINPWLALVTLLPLPFIAWMIRVVRDRLRTGFEKIDRV
ncbi:MAG: ABC transporter, partial [Sulfuricellaceae bacterium]|nr:ABC transporter [Sulfuricellaceae bacterium]